MLSENSGSLIVDFITPRNRAPLTYIESPNLLCSVSTTPSVRILLYNFSLGE